MRILFLYCIPLILRKSIIGTIGPIGNTSYFLYFSCKFWYSNINISTYFHFDVIGLWKDERKRKFFFPTQIILEAQIYLRRCLRDKREGLLITKWVWFKGQMLLKIYKFPIITRSIPSTQFYQRYQLSFCI